MNGLVDQNLTTKKVIDSISKKSSFCNFSGINPTDRGKRGIKHIVLVDRKGAPLFVHVSAANTHDLKLFEPILSMLHKSKNTRIISADSAFVMIVEKKYCLGRKY